MARIIEISYFAHAIARSRTYGRHAFFDSHVISQKMASLSRLPVQGSVCELVKVMIEKFDDRSGERIMSAQILRRFVIKSLPTDVLIILYVSFLRRRRRRWRISTEF